MSWNFTGLKLSSGGSNIVIFAKLKNIPCEFQLVRNGTKRQRLIEVASDLETLSIDFTEDPGIICVDNDNLPNNLTLEPKKSHTYGFCSDNRIQADFCEKVKGVSVLYHEATFLHQELKIAKKTFHSTAKEAALLAQDIKPDLLILGHYSARYRSVLPLLEEAKGIYKQTSAAVHNDIYDFSKI